jgi:hypothetical protein
MTDHVNVPSDRFIADRLMALLPQSQRTRLQGMLQDAEDDPLPMFRQLHAQVGAMIKHLEARAEKKKEKCSPELTGRSD